MPSLKVKEKSAENSGAEATPDPIDISPLVAVALRSYLHCKRKIDKKLEFTERENKTYLTTKLLIPIWEALEGSISENLEVLGYADFETNAENGWVKLPVGSRCLYYPFALSRHPPRPDVLEELANAAETYRLFENSVICLSGSAPLGGVLETIADLDLFEYADHKCVSYALKKVDPKYREDDVICIRSKLSTIQGDWPNEFEYKSDAKAIHHSKIRRYSAKLMNHANFCKIDMIGKFSSLWGEVTNVVYKYDVQDGNDDLPTHTFQEITVDTEPFMNSGSLKNFGHYCFFLRDTIEDYAIKLASVELDPNSDHAVEPEDNAMAVKAAKRAISLCSLLDFEWAEFEEIANSSSGSKYVLEQLLSVVQDLLKAPDATTKVRDADKMLRGMIETVVASWDPHNDEFSIPDIVGKLLGLVEKMDELCFPNTLNSGV